MSCYLTFYGVPRKSKENEHQEQNEEKPIKIVSFSRNNEIYRYFTENIDIYYCYEETKYTDLSDDKITNVIEDINNDIRSSEKRLYEYEKYVSTNPDYIQEILSIKEYLEDLNRALHYTEFIQHMVYGCDYEYSNCFEKIVCNLG